MMILNAMSNVTESTCFVTDVSAANEVFARSSEAIL